MNSDTLGNYLGAECFRCLPESTPVALLNVIPPGSAPLRVNVGGGAPTAVTVNEPGALTTNVTALALVNFGAGVGITLLEGADAGPTPAALVAVTVKV